MKPFPGFFEACRRLGLTTFIICEMMGEMKNQYGEYGIEDYLSDGVIHLTMERSGDQINGKNCHCQDATYRTTLDTSMGWAPGMCKFTIHWGLLDGH
ncbi:MAG: hypothetical protein Ct9H90mP16_17470 [Candidatus Poseidoniales archaeon]|nr:MAG: hypothetical protein Ct9H90mP16_17470 [Candidatus Poseidoniales archaeon]